MPSSLLLFRPKNKIDVGLFKDKTDISFTTSSKKRPLSFLGWRALNPSATFSERMLHDKKIQTPNAN
jgi:hypothetical protein